MSAAMQLRVRNFLGVKKADLSLKGITLLAGRNGAGKSSMVEALSCIIRMSPTVRAVRTKAGTSMLVRDGVDAGSIVLEHGAAARRMLLPGGAIEQTGKFPDDMGTALGVGAVSFSSLDPKQRLTEITERFDIRPKEADVLEWFRDLPTAGVSDEAARLLWAEIEEQGWDATVAKIDDRARRLKARWETTTNRRFGSAIATTWVPQELLSGEEYSEPAQAAVVSQAKGDLEAIIRRAAVGAAERQRLEAQVAQLEALKGQVADAEKEENDLNVELEAMLKQRAALIVPIDASSMPSCPHCGKRIEINRVGAQGYIELIAPKNVATGEAQIKEARKRVATLDGDIANRRNRLRAIGDIRVRLNVEIQNANAARKRLDVVAEQSDHATVAEEEEARSHVLAMERKLVAIQQLHKAREIFADWKQNEHLDAAVRPDGIRKRVLTRGLSAINERLSKLSESASFEPVELTEDLMVFYGGRHYALAAESERWRADLCLTMLLGKQEGARLILVDRFDVLDPQSRLGAIRGIEALGVPALVAMTAKELAGVPDLARAKLGKTVWINQGELEQ